MNDAPKPVGRRALVAWCLYDWASSAFSVIVTTFVFATYFTKAVAADEASGTAAWGYAMSLAAIVIAILGPVCGAIADRAGRRKPWLMGFTIVSAIATMGLWTVAPAPDYAFQGLLLAVIGTIAFELAMVFYNATLTEVAPKGMTGRISGWGWGLGFIGGLVALAISLVVFVQPEPALFGLDREQSEHIRAIPVLVGVWMIVFSLPLFSLVPDRQLHDTPPSVGRAIREGLATLWQTMLQIRQHAIVVKFLLARMFYTDGLNTLFTFGGIFAATAFGMESDEVLLFAISLNATAGIGAMAMAILDDRLGPKPVIAVSIAAIAAFGTAMLLVEDKTTFWLLGLGIGAFVGPAQASSRSLMARISPPELQGEFFGLFAFSGKITAFMGPALLAAAVDATGSQRWGMATIIPFLLIGLVLLYFVRFEARRDP